MEYWEQDGWRPEQAQWRKSPGGSRRSFRCAASVQFDTGIAGDRTLRFASEPPSVEHSAATLKRSTGIILWRMNSDDLQYSKPHQRRGIPKRATRAANFLLRFTAT